MAQNTSQLDLGALERLGVKFLEDAGTGSIKAITQGGFGRVLKTTGLTQTKEELLAAGVSEALFQTGEFRTQEQISEAGGSGRSTGANTLEELFAMEIDPTLGNIRSALEAQSEDIVAIGNEDVARAEAAAILGEDVAFSEAAVQAQVQAGVEAAAAKDIATAGEPLETTTVGEGAEGRQGEGLDIIENEDGTYSVVGADSGTVYDTGFSAIGDALRAQQELGSGFVEPERVAEAPVTDVEIDLDSVLDTDLLSEAMGDPVTETEFEGLVAQSQAAQDRITEALTPSEREVELQSELSAIRQEIDDLVTSFELGVDEIEGQPIPMQFIAGQTSALEKKAQIRLSAAQRAEANLLTDLGVEVSKRELELAAAQTDYSFFQENVQLAFQVQDRLAAQESAVLEEAQALSQGARESLSSVLETFEGFAFSDLSSESQAAVLKLASDAGLSPSLVIDGMSAVKSQFVMDQLGESTLSTMEQLGLASDLRKEFEGRTEVEDFRSIQRSYEAMLSVLDDAASGEVAPARDAMVVLFNKMLDPGSVVREGEFARTSEGQALLDRLSEEVKRLAEGGAGITPEVINQMAGTAQQLFGSAQQGIQPTVDLFTQEANEAGLDVGRVISSTESNLISLLTPLADVTYNSLTDLVVDRPEYEILVTDLLTEFPSLNDQEIVDLIREAQGTSQQAFNQDPSTSVNGSSVLDLGVITGYGSPAWDHGLDIDLKIGDTVPTPVAGEVVFAGWNPNGFGNQVQVRTSAGNVVWLSHLDGVGVQVGDRVTAGSSIGTGGNTGTVIPGEGGDGSHLDLTVQMADGSFMDPREIEQRLRQFA